MCTPLIGIIVLLFYSVLIEYCICLLYVATVTVVDYDVNLNVNLKSQ